jgi:hypothetical protein
MKGSLNSFWNWFCENRWGARLIALGVIALFICLIWEPDLEQIKGRLRGQRHYHNITLVDEPTYFTFKDCAPFALAKFRFNVEDRIGLPHSVVVCYRGKFGMDVQYIDPATGSSKSMPIALLGD